MLTPRNIFIINLAISDLTLCVFTQPLNLYLLMTNHWALGSFMCKFVTMAQGTNLFVSTISITAIALDRFQVRAAQSHLFGRGESENPKNYNKKGNNFVIQTKNPNKIA